MRNPTTKVAAFNGSLDGFVGVDPIRYSNGLLLEAAVTNYVRNPVGGGGSKTGWVEVGTSSVSSVSTLPGPLPDWMEPVVTTGIRITTSANITGAVAASLAVTLPAAALYRLLGFVWIPSGFTGGGVQIRGDNYVGSTRADATLDLSKRDQWQAVSGAITPVAGDLDGSWSLYVTGNAMKTSEEFWVTCAAIQNEVAATSPAVGSIGAGYAWVSTAHNSASIRAASSASISPTGIIAPYTGALAFRATPTIETGVEECWGECGVKGSGTDHLRWGRDSSKHPFVEWSANDAAYERLTSAHTLNAGSQALISLSHDGTAIALSVNDNTIETDSRAAVSDSWGAGDLKLQATKGGVIYDGFAAFNRALTDADIAILDATEEWTDDMILDPDPVRRSSAWWILFGR